MQQKIEFPSSGLVRIASILRPAGPIPLGKTAFWKLIKSRGIKSIKLGRATAFRAEDILGLMEMTESSAARRAHSRSRQLSAKVKQNETTGAGHDR